MKRETINYTLVGLVVLAALVLLLVSLYAITGKGGPSTSYVVRYRNVTGLTYGAPIFYEGYRIGQVGGIEPLRKGGRTEYVVALDVRRDWPIPADSVARLASSGLLADVSIAIREGRAAQPLKPGAEIKGEEAADIFSAMNELAGEVTVLTRERITPLIETLSTRVDSITTSIDTQTPLLFEEASALLAKLNTAAASVNDVLSPQNKGNIDQTLAHIRDVTADLKGTQERLDNLMLNIEQIAVENRPTVREAVLNVSQITASIARRIDAIANHLESSSRNLDEFSREIRKSPNRLLFTPPADDVIVEDE